MAAITHKIMMKYKRHHSFQLVYRTELCVSLLPENEISLLRQFRCVVLQLATKRVQYRQIPSNERYCTFSDGNAIEDEIPFLSTCNFYSQFLKNFNDKFVKHVDDFISKAWYKRRHALFNWTHITLFCFILLLLSNLYCIYCIFVVTNKSSKDGYFV